MGIFWEAAGDAARDLDFSRPRVVVTEDLVILENVSAIVMVSDTAITVGHGLKRQQRFTTITGTGLVIREISEGRMLIGGRIQKAEFLWPQSPH